MEDDQSFLARISITIGVIGLLIIYISSLLLTAESVVITNISRQRAGERVQIVGQVTAVNHNSGTTFLTLKDKTGSIPGVIFSQYNISAGEEVVAEGEIDIYQGELEMIVNKIERRNT